MGYIITAIAYDDETNKEHRTYFDGCEWTRERGDSQVFPDHGSAVDRASDIPGLDSPLDCVELSDATFTSEIKEGDFIEVPAWGVVGCVFAKRTATTGGASSVEVDLQEDPDSDDTRCYRIENDQFNWA